MCNVCVCMTLSLKVFVSDCMRVSVIYECGCVYMCECAVCE